MTFLELPGFCGKDSGKFNQDELCVESDFSVSGITGWWTLTISVWKQ